MRKRQWLIYYQTHALKQTLITRNTQQSILNSYISREQFYQTELLSFLLLKTRQFRRKYCKQANKPSWLLVVFAEIFRQPQSQETSHRAFSRSKLISPLMSKIGFSLLWFLESDRDACTSGKQRNFSIAKISLLRNHQRNHDESSWDRQEKGELMRNYVSREEF